MSLIIRRSSITIARFEQQVSALRPDQFRKPSRERDGSEEPLGYADEYLKAVNTMLMLKADTINELAAQEQGLFDRLDEIKCSKDSAADEVIEIKRELAALMRELSRAQNMYLWMEDHLYAEAVERIPGITCYSPIEINSDWSFTEVPLRGEEEDSPDKSSRKEKPPSKVPHKLH